MNNALLIKAKRNFAEAYNIVIEPIKPILSHEIPEGLLHGELWKYAHYKPVMLPIKVLYKAWDGTTWLYTLTTKSMLTYRRVIT
jgi:hypothetical protein